MDYSKIHEINFTPVTNYNNYLKSGAVPAFSEKLTFENILQQQTNAMQTQPIETPSKIEGGIQMVDFDKIIADSIEQREKAEKAQGLIGQLSKSVNKSLNDVNQKMVSAEKAQEAFAMGEDVSVHDVMIAAEKSSLSFQMAMQIRNKMLTAYSEINSIRV